MASLFKRGKGKRTFVLRGSKESARLSKHKTLKASMQATLGGDIPMETAIKCPEGEDLNEWLAVQTTEIVEAASMVWGTIAEHCLPEQTCRTMTAGNKYEYLWQDSVNYKKATALPAKEYIENTFDWAEKQISDSSVFPVEDEEKFPKNFDKIVGSILKRIFRMYAHIYYTHFQKMKDLGFEAHLNSCFKHLLYCILEFELVDEKELTPLQKLIDKIKKREK